MALALSGPAVSIFFTRPISGVLMVIAIALFLLPIVQLVLRRVRNRSAKPTAPVEACP